MKRLNLYIGRSLLQTTLVAIGILTFVMICGSFLQMFELLSRGVSVWVLVRFVSYATPVAMGFTLPLAVLAASVMVFSRMSADQEVTAMRASGISLWQIVAPGLLLAASVSAVCLYFQTYLIPESQFRLDALKSSGTIVNPVNFLEPGRMVKLSGCIVYVGWREENRLEDIQIYILDEKDRVEQDIHAASGTVEYDEASKTLLLRLEQALFGIVGRAASGGGSDEIQRTRADEVEIPVRLVDDFKDDLLTRKVKHLSMRGLLSLASIYEQHGVPSTPLYLQLHKRLVMALSPIGFLLMGIPFGIRTHRSETVAGAVVSLALAMIFYIFIALADSLDKQEYLFPEVIIWVPIVAYQIGGLYALKRIAAR